MTLVELPVNFRLLISGHIETDMSFESIQRFYEWLAGGTFTAGKLVSVNDGAGEFDVYLTAADRTYRKITNGAGAAGAIPYIPDYSAIETINRWTGTNFFMGDSWTADRTGFVLVSFTTNSTGFYWCDINGERAFSAICPVNGFGFRADQMLAVYKGDIVSTGHGGSIPSGRTCFYVPPREVQLATSNLSNEPHKWELNKEIDLGDGSFGYANNVNVTAAVNTIHTIPFPTMGLAGVIDCGGWWFTGFGNERAIIGRNNNLNDTVRSLMSMNPDESYVQTVSPQVRNNRAVWFWIRYLK